MSWVLTVVAALLLGHVVRRATPWLLADASREMPFEGPFVELTAAVLFLVTALEVGHGFEALKWYLFVLCLLAIGTADAHRKYVPVNVCWFGLAAGLVLSATFPADILHLLGQRGLAEQIGLGGWQAGLALSAAGALMGFAEIWFVRRIFFSLAGIEAMGLGDAFIMMMVGAWLGPQGALFALLPACLIGVAVGGVRQLMWGTPHLAFGPALALGSLAIALFGDRFVTGIHGFNDWLYDLPPVLLMSFALFLVALLVFLVLRLRRKGAEYEAEIERDYAEIDEKMKPGRK